MLILEKMGRVSNYFLMKMNRILDPEMLHVVWIKERQGDFMKIQNL